MTAHEFSHIADDGKSIHTYRWSPAAQPKACILLAHGMAEHAGRYGRLAEALTKAGYELWAPDHRGHGKTASEGELGWLAPRDGFQRVVADLRGLALRIASEQPGRRLVLFGHSWGSFLAQSYVIQHGQELAACILSGTAMNSGPMVGLGNLLARLGGGLRGQKRPSPLLDRLSFGAFNTAFKPTRTAFDWLSRDEAEVDRYCQDPYCGFVASFGFFRDLTSGLGSIGAPANLARLPAELPVLMFAGEKDPVGAASGGFDRLYAAWQSRGMRNLSRRLYPEGRHEMLNETNRQEVMADIIDWLDKSLA